LLSYRHLNTINITRHANAQLYTPDNKQPEELSHCSLVDTENIESK